jgi:hypothetical protein
MDLASSLLMTLLALTGLLLLPLYLRRITRDLGFKSSRNSPNAISPNATKSHTAVHNTDGPFIPMPDSLTTKDEMVTWLIHDLPRLTSGQRERRE